MSSRVKYPLSASAQEAAKTLSEAWKLGELDQLIRLAEAVGDNRIMNTTATSAYSGKRLKPPPRAILMELARFGLIQLYATSERGWEVLLLEELHTAVQNDFEVSDYFLTTSAVGTIIYGNLTLDKGALFQSAAAGIGDVNVTAQTLPDELVRLLGEDAQRPEIAAAITALKTADDPTRLEKMGKVIEELGRGLAHLTNTGGAIAAITLIAKILSGGGL